MASTAPTPKVVKQPRAPKSGPGGPTIWQKILEKKFLFAAIVFHVLLAIGATSGIVAGGSVFTMPAIHIHDWKSTMPRQIKNDATSRMHTPVQAATL